MVALRVWLGIEIQYAGGPAWLAPVLILEGRRWRMFRPRTETFVSYPISLRVRLEQHPLRVEGLPLQAMKELRLSVQVVAAGREKLAVLLALVTLQARTVRPPEQGTACHGERLWQPLAAG